MKNKKIKMRNLWMNYKKVKIMKELKNYYKIIKII